MGRSWGPCLVNGYRQKEEWWEANAGQELDTESTLVCVGRPRNGARMLTSNPHTPDRRERTRGRGGDAGVPATR